MPIGKLCRVVKDKNRRIACRHESLPRRCEVTCQNVGFTDSIIPKKSIRGLSVCPVLAGPRSGRAYFARQLLQQLSQPFAMPSVLELASHNFIVNPCIRFSIRRFSASDVA